MNSYLADEIEFNETVTDPNFHFKKFIYCIWSLKRWLGPKFRKKAIIKNCF